MTFPKTLAASCLAMTLAAAPAVLMTTQTGMAQTAAEPGEATFSETELDAFVAAFVEVSDLREVYTERLQQATDETAHQAIVAEGNAAIVAAIEEVEGMDVELYSAILEQAAADPSLNERLTERLQDAAEG